MAAAALLNSTQLIVAEHIRHLLAECGSLIYYFLSVEADLPTWTIVWGGSDTAVHLTSIRRRILRCVVLFWLKLFHRLWPDPKGVLLLGSGWRGSGQEGNHLPVLHHTPLPCVRRADPAGRVLTLPRRTPASGCYTLPEHEAVGESARAAAEGEREAGTDWSLTEVQCGLYFQIHFTRVSVCVMCMSSTVDVSLSIIINPFHSKQSFI